MKKEFIPYEECKELKELGFDEPCIAICPQHESEFYYIFDASYVDRLITKNPDTFMLAPLYQQAFRWFREKHDLFHSITPKRCYPDNAITGVEFYCQVENGAGEETMHDSGVRGYEESELACLRKMIEILKERKKNE